MFFSIQLSWPFQDEIANSGLGVNLPVTLGTFFGSYSHFVNSSFNIELCFWASDHEIFRKQKSSFLQIILEYTIVRLYMYPKAYRMLSLRIVSFVDKDTVKSRRVTYSQKIRIQNFYFIFNFTILNKYNKILLLHSQH